MSTSIKKTKKVKDPFAERGETSSVPQYVPEQEKTITKKIKSKKEKVESSPSESHDSDSDVGKGKKKDKKQKQEDIDFKTKEKKVLMDAIDVIERHCDKCGDEEVIIATLNHLRLILKKNI